VKAAPAPSRRTPNASRILKFITRDAAQTKSIFMRWNSYRTSFLQCLLFLTGIFSSMHLQAWNETGHMLVAEIAKQNLKPNAKKEVDQLLTLFTKDYPKSSSAMTCACWADDIREGIDAFSHWHFTLNIFDPEHVLSPESQQRLLAGNDNNNVEWAIKQARSTLDNPKANSFEKAFMLRFLIHFVGDIHQPLHCTTRFSKKFPNGDSGGNFFMLADLPYKNLHKYWDSGLGQFKIFNRPLNGNDQKEIELLSKQIMEKYPLNKHLKLINDLVPSWTQESYQLAVSFAYSLEEGSKPNPDYIQKGQQIVQERIALAGYRLAYLLNTIFKRS